MLARGFIGELKYRNYRRQEKANDCAFCPERLPTIAKTVIEETSHFVIYQNNFPYKKWSGFKVKSHAVIIPKRHTLQMSDLTKDEKTEFMQLITKYDNLGHSFYIRSHSDIYRSIGHIHGHLFTYM